MPGLSLGLGTGLAAKPAAASAPPFDGQYVNGGDFASATPWTLSTPASSNISGGKLNFTAAAGTRRCYQPSLGTYVQGNTYRVTGTVSNVVDTSAGLPVRLGTDASGLNGTLVTLQDGDPEWPVAAGPFSVDIVLATLTGQNHMIGASSLAEFSIDNVSIVQL